MDKTFVSPEGFWEEYVKMLNNGDSKLTRDDYENNTVWTEKIIGLVRKMVGRKMETHKEYFRIDVTGYTTKWEEEKGKASRREKEEGIRMAPLHNWRLLVAYEHENSGDWNDELCKLCHVAADLKVISAYCDFRKEDIAETLKYYIARLKAEGTMRRAEGKWLFVFGPRKRSGDSFKAFTLNDELNVIPLKEEKISFLASER